jgi:hypothetical protein
MHYTLRTSKIFLKKERITMIRKRTAAGLTADKTEAAVHTSMP